MKRVGLLGLLLGALLLRAGIPTGMMLVSTEGSPHLVPCPSVWGAPVAAAATHHGGHHGATQQPAHDHQGQEPPCPFGVLLFRHGRGKPSFSGEIFAMPASLMIQESVITVGHTAS